MIRKGTIVSYLGGFYKITFVQRFKNVFNLSGATFTETGIDYIIITNEHGYFIKLTTDDQFELLNIFNKKTFNNDALYNILKEAK